MPIPSGALYPGESENHRAARRAEAERERRAERPRPRLSARTPPPLPRKKPTPPASQTPCPPPTAPPAADQPRRTWRDLDPTEINRF